METPAPQQPSPVATSRFLVVVLLAFVAAAPCGKSFAFPYNNGYESSAGMALKASLSLQTIPVAAPSAALAVTAVSAPVPAAGARGICPQAVNAAGRGDSAATALTLQQIVERARQNNPDIARAQSQIRKARADLDTAAAAYSPIVKFGANSGRQDGFGFGNNGLATTANAQLSKLLHDFGKTDSLIEEARKREEARVQEQEDTIDRITLDITETWLNAVRQGDMLRLHEDAAAALEEAVSVLRQRAQVGLMGAGEVELAQARLVQVRAAAVSVCAQREQYLSRLALLSGGPVGMLDTSAPAYLMGDGPSSVWDASMLPAVRQADAEYQAAIQHEQSVRASRWPSVYLQAVHNTKGTNGLPTASNAVNLSLNMDVLDTAASSRIDSAGADVQAALLHVQSTRQTAEDNLRKTRIDLQSLEARRPLLQAQAQSTAVTRRSFMDQFLAGRRQMLDLLNTHQEVLSADLAVSGLAFDRMVLVARLHGLYGELTDLLSTPSPASPPASTSLPAAASSDPNDPVALSAATANAIPTRTP